MTPEIQEVKAHLSILPRQAAELAESTGLTIETVYHSLAWLHDRDQARIEQQWKCGRQWEIAGWVEGVKA